MEAQKQITLDIDFWIVVTPIGTPVHPDANFTSALKCLVQVQEQSSGFKLMQTETHLLLPSKVALGLKGIPIALTVPGCPRCHSDLEWRRSKFGGFFGCPSYPACSVKVKPTNQLVLADPTTLRSKGMI